MDQETTALRWVDKLRHQLESARCESQDRVAEATGAWAVELCAVKRATTTKRELNAMKVHLVETEAAL